MLTLERKAEVLSNAAIFASLSPNLLAQVASRSGEKNVANGTLLFSEGSPGDTIYLIVTGKVEIFRRSAENIVVSLAVLNAGEILGEMAALGGGIRTASARAAEPTTLLFIKSKALKALISKVPNFGFDVFHILVARLTDANDRLLAAPSPAMSLGRAVTKRAPVRAPYKEEAAHDLVDCPNCFEQIQPRSTTCDFCGVKLQNVELTVACLQCGHSQPPGGNFCRACGVELKTGRLPDRPGKRPCPRCGLTSSGSETICVVCGTSFDRWPLGVRLQDAAAGVTRTVSAHLGKAFIVALLAGGGWAWVNRDRIDRQVQGALHGERIASVRRAADEIIRFLPYRDAASIMARMTPEAQARLRERGEEELAALWGRQVDTETLTALAIQEVRPGDPGQSERTLVYLKAEILLPPDGQSAPIDPSGVVGKGLQELLQPKGKRQERFLIWSFSADARLDAARAGSQR